MAGGITGILHLLGRGCRLCKHGTSQREERGGTAFVVCLPHQVLPASAQRLGQVVLDDHAVAAGFQKPRCAALLVSPRTCIGLMSSPKCSLIVSVGFSNVSLALSITCGCARESAQS